MNDYFSSIWPRSYSELHESTWTPESATKCIMEHVISSLACKWPQEEQNAPGMLDLSLQQLHIKNLK